jgi:hypothetical protein
MRYLGGRKYTVIHIKNITCQVGLIQYSANTVVYKTIVFSNDNIQSTERDIEPCKMNFFHFFHSLSYLHWLIRHDINTFYKTHTFTCYT